MRTEHLLKAFGHTIKSIKSRFFVIKNTYIIEQTETAIKATEMTACLELRNAVQRNSESGPDEMLS